MVKKRRARRSTWAERDAPAPESAALSSRVAGSRGVFDDFRCDVCRAPLDGSEPYWMVAYPRAAHSRCLDWRARPFPFTRQLRALRRAWRETHDDEARREIVVVGRALAALERRWRAGERRFVDVDEANLRLRGLVRFVGRAGVSAKLREVA